MSLQTLRKDHKFIEDIQENELFRLESDELVGSRGSGRG
jgi:hypothetical protein